MENQQQRPEGKESGFYTHAQHQEVSEKFSKLINAHINKLTANLKSNNR